MVCNLCVKKVLRLEDWFTVFFLHFMRSMSHDGSKPHVPLHGGSQPPLQNPRSKVWPSDFDTIPELTNFLFLDDSEVIPLFNAGIPKSQDKHQSPQTDAEEANLVEQPPPLEEVGIQFLLHNGRHCVCFR